VIALPVETQPDENPIKIGPSARKADWPTIGVVSLIVLLGLALRLWGIGWSLPNAQHPLATYHPDELVNLQATQAIDIPHGQFDTHFYNYGTFYFYLASFAQTFGRGYGLVPATPAPSADLSHVEQMTRLAPEMAGLYLAGRITTALLGTATIALLFALGTRLYGRKTGFLAAMMYAVAPLAVVHAHFLTVDVPATFFVTFALLCASRLLTTPTRKNYVLAGIACGLCAATKYNTGLVLAAPLMAHFLNRRFAYSSTNENIASPPSGFLGRGAGGEGLLLLIGVALLTFLIACPGPWLNWNTFWNGTYHGTGVRYELFEHSRQGHGPQFEQTGLGWVYHLLVSLPYGMGILLLLLSLVGVAYACRQRTKGDLILLAFFLLYYLATGLSAVRFARYMLPLFPVLCLFAARFVCEPFPRPRPRLVLYAIGCVVTLVTLIYTVGLVRHMAQPDPRDVAAAYLNDHAAPGAAIAFATTPWYYSPPLSPRFGELAASRRALAAQEVTRYQLRLPAPNTEWDISVFSPAPDYIVISNLETLHVVDRLRQPTAVAWMNAIPQNYTRKTFGSSDVFGLPPNRTIIPEDLLYIMPTLTVYEKR
jgi:4-amino-4-deoxy-L-arabinose transferase-like glycosyltransferase